MGKQIYITDFLGIVPHYSIMDVIGCVPDNGYGHDTLLSLVQAEMADVSGI